MDQLSLPPELKLSGEEPPRISITLDAKTSELLLVKFTPEAKVATVKVIEIFASDFVQTTGDRGRRRENILEEDVEATSANLKSQSGSGWARFAAIMGGTLFGAGISALLIIFLKEDPPKSYLMASLALVTFGAFFIGTEVRRA